MGIFGRLKDLELKFKLVNDSNSRLGHEVKYLEDKVGILYKRNETLSFKIDNPDGLVYFLDNCYHDGEIGYKFVNDDEIVDLILIEDASCLYKYKICKMSDHVLKLSLIYKEAGKKHKSNSSDMKEFVIDTEDESAVEISNLKEDDAIGWVTMTDFE